MRDIVTMVLAAALLSTVAPAQAQRRGNQPSAETRQAAREAYGRAQRLLSEGDLDGARAAFEEAYGHIPNPVVLLGLAEAHVQASDLSAAVETFERYLREREDAPDRAQVQSRIEELRRRPATLVVTSDPPGARIEVDGEPHDGATPAEIEVASGEHEVVLSMSGFQPARRTFEATFGARVEVDLVLEEDVVDGGGGGVGDGILYDEPVRDDDDDGGVPASVWIMSAVTGAALASGAVFGFLALDEEKEFDAMPTEASADRGERWLLIADISFGLAAAAGITTLVLLLTSGGSDDGAGEAAVNLAPTLSPDGAGVLGRARF